MYPLLIAPFRRTQLAYLCNYIVNTVVDHWEQRHRLMQQLHDAEVLASKPGSLSLRGTAKTKKPLVKYDVKVADA